MDFIVKTFEELTTEELWALYELRNKVFIVEQNCAYQDIDASDKKALHILVFEGEKLVGYARVLPAHTTFDEVSFGRVISLKRRSGLGTQIVTKALELAVSEFHADKVVIEAQVYAASLYEKVGFQAVGEEFLEDGIPHIQMEWYAEERSN